MNGCFDAARRPVSGLGKDLCSLVVLVLGMLVVACEAPSAEADSYRTLSSDEVSRLKLVPLDSLVLTVPGGLINGITDFQRHDGRYYLLDGDDKVVHVFDAGGNHLLSFGGEGSGPGEFRRPVGLGFDRDEVLVFDPGQGSLMHAFGNDGTFRAAEQLPLPRSRPLWSVEVAEEKLYLLTSGNADSAGGGWDLLTVIDSNFEVVGQGCRVDGRTVESERSHGMIGAFPPTDVAVRDGRVYCVQPISPIVQVMDAGGKTLGGIVVAPPFYRAPVDRPLSMNQKEAFEDLAGFTSNNAFYPLRDGPGFVSVYSSFDLELGGFRYWLFRCTLDAGWEAHDCAMTESTRKPILVTPGGEVFLEEEGEADDPPVVGIYRLTAERVAR